MRHQMACTMRQTTDNLDAMCYVNVISANTARGTNTDVCTNISTNISYTLQKQNSPAQAHRQSSRQTPQDTQHVSHLSPPRVRMLPPTRRPRVRSPPSLSPRGARVNPRSSGSATFAPQVGHSFVLFCAPWQECFYPTPCVRLTLDLSSPLTLTDTEISVLILVLT
jgi:hypothetical protein